MTAQDDSAPLGVKLTNGLGLAAERDGVSWELALLAQTLEFSDDARTKIQRGADEIERLRAAVRGLLDALPSRHLCDEPPPRLSDLADGLLKAKAVARDVLRRA